MTSNKVWLPVGDGDYPLGRSDGLDAGVEIAGDKLVDAPAPAAWGPPMAQPDAEGWWAFEGDTPDELGVRLLAEVYPADPDGGDLELFAETDRAGGGYYAYEMTGTWRKLLVDPWEAES